jgi:hypothetical protein
MELSGRLYSPAPFRGRSSRCLLNSSSLGSKNWSGYFGEAKNFLPLPGIEPQFLGSSGRNRVTVLIVTSRLPVDRNVRSNWADKFSGISRIQNVLEDCVTVGGLLRACRQAGRVAEWHVIVDILPSYHFSKRQTSWTLGFYGRSC